MILDDGSGKKEKEPTFPIAARFPKSLFDAVKKRAGERRGELTRVVLDTVQFSVRFAELLVADKRRIVQFALDEGLDWPAQEPEVYARLIKLGLLEAERRRK